MPRKYLKGENWSQVHRPAHLVPGVLYHLAPSAALGSELTHTLCMMQPDPVYMTQDTHFMWHLSQTGFARAPSSEQAQTGLDYPDWALVPAC